jgi:hypothetical protein
MAKFIISSTITFFVYKAVKNALEEAELKQAKKRLSDDRA